MTAVNLNAMGNIKQLMQSVSTTNVSTRKDVSKQDFETVMNDKVSKKTEKPEVTEKTETKTGKKEAYSEEPVKQPNRTEVSTNGNPRARELASGKEEPQITLEEEPDVSEVVEEIMAGLMQILNITPEELQTAMDTLELEVGDLTDRNNVASLVLFLNDASDISDMLVDNGMLETFNEVNDFIEKTLSDAGINPPDFKAMIEKAQEVPAENVETVMVTEEDLPVKTQEPQKAVVRNDVVKEASTETETVEEEQDAPEITIVKHDDSKETGTNSGNSENGSAEAEVLPEKTESSLNTKSVRVDREPVNPAENFVKNLELAVEATEEIPENTPDIREIVYQVVDRIRVDISPENTSMEMRLNPENLGRVAINITSREGVMTAEIRTENRQAREAIESQLQILKDNIEAKGIRVEAVEVRISDFNFADSKNSENSSEEFENRNQGRARRNRGFSVGEEGIDTEAEKLENEVLISSGSTVSYRA